MVEDEPSVQKSGWHKRSAKEVDTRQGFLVRDPPMLKFENSKKERERRARVQRTSFLSEVELPLRVPKLPLYIEAEL